jgi:type IV secretory pathway VirB2 component (pilin)
MPSVPRYLPVLAAFTVVLLALCVPALALADSPIQTVTQIFEDALQLFLGKIIPGLAVAVIAWTGISIAMGRKNLMDSIPIIAGAAMALLAGVIVAYLQTAG